MALVRVTNVNVLNNPAEFSAPMQFEITFESAKELPDDTEWKIVYVGSAESESYDQELDSVLVGPVPQGSLKFVFQVDAPEPKRIPKEELLGVTVVLITGSYRSQEFIRIGYYVNVELPPELVQEEVQLHDIPHDKLIRNILSSNPRVTRFPIKWEDDQAELMPQPGELRPGDDEGMSLDQMGEGDMDQEEDDEDDDDVGDYEL